MVRMPAWHAGDLGSIPGPGTLHLGVKTWLSTLEIVCLSDETLIYTIICLKSVWGRSQTAGHNSCSIASRDVSN